MQITLLKYCYGIVGFPIRRKEVFFSQWYRFVPLCRRFVICWVFRDFCQVIFRAPRLRFLWRSWLFSSASYRCTLFFSANTAVLCCNWHWNTLFFSADTVLQLILKHTLNSLISILKHKLKWELQFCVNNAHFTLVSAKTILAHIPWHPNSFQLKESSVLGWIQYIHVPFYPSDTYFDQHFDFWIQNEVLFGFGLFALVLVSVCVFLVLLVLHILPNEKRGNWCWVQEGQQWYLKAWKSFIEHHGTPLERITGEGWRRLYGLDRLESIACNVLWVLSTSVHRTNSKQWGLLKLEWKQ